MLVAAAIGGGAAIAGGVGDDGADQPITGAALAKAKAAALAHTGGGRVTGTEVGDEESHYEVEVTRADGSQVDVQLDKAFNVVGSKDDGTGPGRAGRQLSVSVRLTPLAAALALCAGCGGDGGSALPQGSEQVELDPADFTTDDRQPLLADDAGHALDVPRARRGGRRRWTSGSPSATRRRRIANGVTARVVRDTVTADGEVIEDTFDWYAQDGDGNVWYLGEQTAEFEDGKVSSRGGSFEAGVDGAQAGVIMPADPEPGLAYRQEYYKGEAEDNGEVLSLHEQAQVPAGHYRDALLTKDTIAIEPDVLEYKLYAPGVGPVLTLGVSGGGGREQLVRVDVVDDEAARAAGTTPLGRDYP